jgi:hypothetical protein
MGGWLAWWMAPVGSGPRRRTSGARRRDPRKAARDRSRMSGTAWGPTSLAWWLARPGTPAPARVADHDRPVKVRGGPRTCPLCHKAAACRCRMVKGEPIRRRRRPPGAQPYAYPPDFRANGAVWCGSCRHRINTYTGHCSNRQCGR